MCRHLFVSIVFSSMFSQASIKTHIAGCISMHDCVIFVGHDDTNKAKHSWLSLLVRGETAQTVVSFVLQFYV